MENKFKKLHALVLVVLLSSLNAFCATMTLVDQLDRLERDGGFIFTKSSISGSEIASFFTLEQDAQISQLIWSGVIKNSPRTSESFLIRLYHDIGEEPELTAFYELQVEADVTAADTSCCGGDSSPTIFESEAIEDLRLESGDYWLSILDPELTDMNFFWAIEPDGVFNTILGSGGASRQDVGSPWHPRNDGITIKEGRGSSFLIEGSPSSVVVPEPGTLALFALGIIGIALRSRSRK